MERLQEELACAKLQLEEKGRCLEEVNVIFISWIRLGQIVCLGTVEGRTSGGTRARGRMSDTRSQ